MATIYKFQDSESTISSTDTTPLAVGDSVPLYSTNAVATRKATVGTISSLWKVTSATSATTGTNISAYGFTSLGSSSGPVTSWLIDDPPAVGIKKEILSLSTSTANTVTRGGSATFSSTVAWAGTTITFIGAGQFVQLTSISTARWVVTAWSSAVLLA